MSGLPNIRSLSVRSTSGGDWRVLVSGVGWKRAPSISSDGNWIWYGDTDSAGISSLFRVPTAGGLPQRMGALPRNFSNSGFLISPDGRQVLSPRGIDVAYGLWIMENFVPAASK